MKDEQGFTLVELLVVLVAAGILSAMAIPSLLGLYNPLKNTAAMVDGKLSQMMLMARADQLRMYCLEVNLTNWKQVDGFSYDSSFKKRQEPSLDFKLPEGVDFNFESTYQAGAISYDDGYSIPSQFNYYSGMNQGYVCSDFGDSNRSVPSNARGKSSSGNTASFNGVLGGRRESQFDYFVISRQEGNTTVEAGLIVNSVGQSSIFYRKRLADGSIITLPNY